MSQLVFKVNKKQVNPQTINYFTYEGKFNYYVEVDINGQVPETTSDILVQVYKQKDKRYTMSCDLNWFIEKDNFQNKLNHNNKHFQVSALQYNQKLICKITPTEQGFFGECRLYYGPIQLNKKFYDDYQKIQKQDFFELNVKGVSLQNMTNFETIELNKNKILTHDQNFQTVNDIKINNNFYISNSSQNPLQIKINSKSSNLEILDIKTQSLKDRDLFILLLNDKLKQKRNSNYSQNFGRQCEQQLTNQIQDVSMVKRNTQQNNSISSFRSINRLIRGKNPLQKRVDQNNASQRSLSYQTFQVQKGQRNVSQNRNEQNQFSVEQDSIVNKYLVNNKSELKNQKPSFGKISFKQNQQIREVSPLQTQVTKPQQQQNYFKVTESFDRKYDASIKLQKNIKQQREVSQERIANVELNKKNQNLYTQNQNYLQTIKRLQITNKGLKRELDFIKIQKQKNEEQESILKDQKETAMRNQYNILNDKYQQQKKQVFEFETKLEEIQKRLLNTQNSLMETENQKYLLQNQLREQKDNKQIEWEKIQILQKENSVLKSEIDDLQQKNQFKQKIESDLNDKINLIKNLQNTIKTLKQQNDFKDQEQEDLVKDLNHKDKKIMKLEQRNEDLYDQLDLIRQDKQDLVEQLQQLKFNQQEQQEQIQNLENFNDYEDKYLLEQKANEMIKNKLQERNEELNDLEDKFQNLKRKYNQLQEEFDEQKLIYLNEDTKEQNQYHKMFDDMRIKYKTLQREFDLIQQEKDILEDSLKEKKKDIENYKIIQIENEEMIDNLSQNLNIQKRQEIEEKQNIEQNYFLNEQKQKLEESEQMYLNLQDNMSKLRQDIFYLREEKFENLEKIQKLQQNLNNKEEDICKLNQQLNIKRIELQNLKCKIDQQDIQLTQLQQNVQTNKQKLSSKKQGYSTRLDMEDILQQKEKQIEYLRQKNKQFQQKIKNKNNYEEQDYDFANSVLKKLKMKDSKINSMQYELNKKTQKIDNLLLILKQNQLNQDQQQNSLILNQIKNHAEKLEQENDNLKYQIQNINQQQRNGDSLNMLGNIEIEDVKEQLLRLLELYEEDLRYEYELLDIEDIVLKLKELIFDLKKARNQLQEKEILLDETNQLLLDYNNEKYDDNNSLLETEIYYDQQLIFLQLNVRILNSSFNNIECFFICSFSIWNILFCNFLLQQHYMFPLTQFPQYFTIFDKYLKKVYKHEMSYQLIELWKITFWITFLNSWVILPFLQFYYDSKEKEFSKKIKYAIKMMVITLLVMLAIFLVFLVYLMIKYKDVELYPILLALANSFGVFLIIFSLGYSLVSWPRFIYKKLYTEKNVAKKMNYIEKMIEQKEEIITILENNYRLLYNCKQKNQNQILQQFYEKAVEDFSLEVIEDLSFPLDQVYDEEVVNSFLKKASKNILQKKIKQTNDYTSQYEILKKKEQAAEKFIQFYQENQHLPQIKIWNNLIMLFFSICVILSTLSFIIEFIIPFEQTLNFNLYGIIQNLHSSFTFIIYLMAILYIIFCVFYAMIKLEVKFFYSLKPKNSDYSICNLKRNVSRVATPLCYNILQIYGVENSHFIEVMGKFDIVPIFGQYFANVFPSVLLILVILNLLNFKNCLKKFFVTKTQKKKMMSNQFKLRKSIEFQNNQLI